jgi:hypothetical protein
VVEVLASRLHFLTICPPSASAGELKTSQPLDREDRDEHRFRVRALDGGGRYCEADVHLAVDDANDNPPRFTSDPYAVTVFENTETGTFVAKLLASDLDTGEPFWKPCVLFPRFLCPYLTCLFITPLSPPSHGSPPHRFIIFIAFVPPIIARYNPNGESFLIKMFKYLIHAVQTSKLRRILLCIVFGCIIDAYLTYLRQSTKKKEEKNTSLTQDFNWSFIMQCQQNIRLHSTKLLCSAAVFMNIMHIS